jgi:hypothetical protein
VRIGSLLALLGALGSGACSNDIPQPPSGERISGTLSYGGPAQELMIRPTARVVFLLDFPPTTTAQAILNIEHPDFSKPVPYELTWVWPGQYKVVAQIIDLDAPNVDTTILPAGGYPDYCSLFRPDAFVTITEDVPIKNADITLYDLGGQTDPCNDPTTVCPARGKSSLNIVVKSSHGVADADTLLYALFTNFPSTLPTSYRKVAGKDVHFPATIIDNKLTPATYAAFYVCLDVGSNSGMGLCTAEDSFVLDRTPLTLGAGQIVTMTVDLDSHTATASIEAPADHGCN